MHICAAATGRGSAELSRAASPRSPVNSAGIQCGSGRGSSGPRCSHALSWAASTVQGGEDLRPFEVTETTRGRQSLYKANINCATSSENNGGQDTQCALIHISIVCPPPLLLLRARSISGVKEGGEGREGGAAAVGAVGVWLCSFSSVCVRMHRRFSSNLMCVPGDI